ncbi:MAG: hypothetical protein RR661_02365, partial [Anaerovoracaceae bacterium]
MGKKRLWKGIVLALVLCMALGLVSCGTKKESKKENNLVVEATSWIAKNDGSNLVFETEKDYVWYEKKDVTEDNYFRGSYRFYMGEAA